MKAKEAEKLIKNISTDKYNVLKMKDTFQFECTACGKCCFNNTVLLNCYDVVRLRNGLQTSTTQIIQKDLISFHIGPFSGLPVCTLEFQNFSPKFTKCPFLLPEMKGSLKLEAKIEKWLCSIHQHRPLACRFYPCGRIKNIDQKSGKVKESFFLQNVKGFCPGVKEEKKQTLEQYLNKSEFKHYNEGSDKFVGLMEKVYKSGFFVPTKKNNSKKAILKQDSKIFFILGNIMYNFDSFNYFSKDERVLKTINDPKATQQDFMYVTDKIETLILHLIKFHKKHKDDDDKIIMQIINKIPIKGGE